MAIFNTVPPLAAGPGIHFDGEVISTGAVHRNLLDNSNFQNPVNQRGQTSYSTAGYTIDRFHKEQTSVFKLGDGCITIDNSASASGEVLIQKIDGDTAANLIGKPITIAVCTTDGQIAVNSGVVEWDKDVAEVWMNGGGVLLRFFRVVKNYQLIRVSVHAGASISLKWAAVYEGAYTAETLPEYQPKGYSAELAECMRYYQIRSSDNIAAVDMRPTMRLSSPTVSEVTGGYAYSADL